MDVDNTSEWDTDSVDNRIAEHCLFDAHPLLAVSSVCSRDPKLYKKSPRGG